MVGRGTLCSINATSAKVVGGINACGGCADTAQQSESANCDYDRSYGSWACQARL